MHSNVKQNDQTRPSVKWYDIPYGVSDYTFPRQAILHHVRFDDDYIHLELADGRVLSVPLSWIPSLRDAPSADREKYKMSEDRKMIVWDPDECSINDELRVDDYLAPK